ncbi:furin-like protease 2 isoform X2 [Bacillus rossius redtenbacheri]|uniref:furin-like protease 2 isoform X2 n=1 Tax=Bacillus rossius redtenbacheri TaxID=93214 RepID=UPI002FDCA060
MRLVERKSVTSFVCLFSALFSVVVCRQAKVYHNQFAVHVPKGLAAADEIASKHGFKNIGQIGSLPNYFLLEHRRLSKRSLTPSEHHHARLSQELEVAWVQQQHEKVRKKRDFEDFQSFSDFPSFFGGSGAASQRHVQYRGIGARDLFPDPLYKEQWYLNGGAKDGFDMNVNPAWRKGYTGKGVVVSILDDGIQTNHPDLALNYDQLASTDINDNDDDPMPRDNGDNKHGTRCAGEVAAVAFNNYCGVGVAYNASVGGVRMLDGTVNDAVEARALGLNPDHIDIYSASWGPEDDGKTVDGPGPLARRAFIYGVTSGRQGKGSIFVWASGNGGRHTDSCNCDGYTNSIFTLSISSATQGGYKPWYLEECSSTLASTYSSGTPGHDRSVATVDMDGRLRPDHICTAEHTGTSASAPLAAGIAALALEANPGLTWRDMQYLVVLTSRSGPLQKEDGWVLNGVKRKVSHKFGYGLMDAGAMVSLAEQWTNIPPQHICKSQELNEDRQIDQTFSSTLTTHVDVNGCSNSLNEVRFLEHVQCKITLRFFPRGNLRVLLTSPMGTTSTLLFERPRDVTNSNFDDWPFLSVHYWGEKAEGRWTLQIVNSGSRRVNQPGLLKKWQLIFYGTATNPIRLRPTGAPGAYPAASLARPQAASQLPFAFPSASTAAGDEFGDAYGQPGFHSFSDVYSAAGSEAQEVSVPLDGEGNSTSAGAEAHCDPECDAQGCRGPGPAQCVRCRNHRIDTTCVAACPPRSFPDRSGACRACHESCETCAGAGQDSCLTCAAGHLRITDLAVCLQQCPEGYFQVTDKDECVPCEPNCASCQERADRCTSCDHHLVLFGGRCRAACPARTYETEDYSCQPCDASCETCTGAGADRCVTCQAGHYAHDGSCVPACPRGHYGDAKRRECVRCPPGCAECDGSACLGCTDGWALSKKGRCVAHAGGRCAATGQFWVEGRCQACHASCLTCAGPSEDDCASCAAPLLAQGQRCVGACAPGWYQERGACAPCLHTCRECLARSNCTACAAGLHLQRGECRATCADGYYSDRGVCTECFLSCRTCSGPRRDQCITCPAGWQLAAGQCHPDCPAGFFKSDYGCLKCHHSCATCRGEGPLQCTSCPDNSALEGGICAECQPSQYYDAPTQLCKGCEPSCAACGGPGPFACRACRPPLHLDRFNSQCVPCCAPGSDGGEGCCPCDPATGECRNPSPAGKRRIAGGAGGAVSEARQGLAARDYASFASVTALVVGVGIAVLAVTGIVFLALQMRPTPGAGAWGRSEGYRQLSTAERRLALEGSDGRSSDDEEGEDLLFARA